MNNVDFGLAFRYPLKEAGFYVKLFFLTIFCLIVPIGAGYFLDVIKLAASDDEDRRDDVLPPMEDFIGFLGRGLGVLVVSFIYLFIPFSVLGTSFLTGLLGAITSFSTHSPKEGLLATLGVTSAGLAVGALLLTGAYLFLPMAMLRLATKGFGACFDFPGMWEDIKKGRNQYLSILVCMVLAFFALSTVVHIITFLVLFYLTGVAYLHLVFCHLLGQYHRAFLAPPEE